MQPGHSVVEAAPPDHAVLSQGPQQHGHHRFQAHPTPLDQPAHHLQIRQHRPRPCRGQSLERWRGGWGGGRGGPRHRRWRGCRACRRFTAPGVEGPLLVPPRLLAVIGRRPLVALLPVMGLPTSKRTTQIVPPRVARVGQKENPAVPTACPAPAQLRLGPQHRSQHRVVSEHQADQRSGSVPIFGEPKKCRDLDCQKPRL